MRPTGEVDDDGVGRIDGTVAVIIVVFQTEAGRVDFDSLFVALETVR
ncbi:MAG: hypothetical protein ACR2RL_20625 [Gammaproteobacteria bacterium]